MATTEFQVNGLTGELDGVELTRSLCSLPGVAAAHVDVTTGTVTLIQRSLAHGHPQLARRVVREAGYELASEVALARWSRVARGSLRRRVRQAVPVHG